MYTVKGLKTWTTHEGGGFQVVLCRDDKPVAEVTNEGVGACFIFRWKDKAPADVHARLYDGRDHVYRGSVEEARLWEHVKTLPAVEVEGQRISMDPDIFVEDLVGDLELTRQVKRWLKKPTFIADGKILQFGGPPRPGIALDVRHKYPNALYLNDLPLEEAVAAVKNLQRPL